MVRSIVAATILGLGIAAAGWRIGEGFVAARATERFVTVKGISEREAEADIALWPIRFVSTDDELARAQAEIQRAEQQVLGFLSAHGIERSAAEVQSLEVTDRLANPYASGPSESRYIVAETLMVRTAQPALVQAASQDVGKLVETGVVLSSTGGPASTPTYLFTGLSELKPEMIAEATAQARRGAEQFAGDSDSRLGKIRRAHQGVFEILPRDQAAGVMEGSQLRKTVRVVSTVEYYLED